MTAYATLKEFFGKLPYSVIKSMLAGTSTEFVPSGQILFSQGDPGDSLYIVNTGRLRYEKTDEFGNILASGDIHKSEMIGEIGIFTGERRTATIRAIRDSELIKIPADLALDILTKNPKVLLMVTTKISERLAKAQIPNPSKDKYTFSLFLPDHFDEPQFLENIFLSLQRQGTLIFVTAEEFYKIFPNLDQFTSAEIEHNVIRWFHDLEEKYDFIVYITKNDFSDWTQRCIRQSDQLIFLKSDEEDSHLSDLEKELFKPQSQLQSNCIYKKIHLGIIHRRSYSFPQNTSKFIKVRKIHSHFHLALDDSRTIDRMVRRLIQRSVAVAFGGGGAKGFAHLGVIRALEEVGIDIDLVAGTSAGSIFAATVAMGLPYSGSRESAKNLWADKDLLGEYTIPFLSLVSGKKYTEAIREFCRGMQIEDLWIPYTAVATDLSQSRRHYFQSGDLWKAIRASTSLPGIVPPFLDGGKIFVDGGLMDNVPGHILRASGVGTLICIDVGGDIAQSEDKEIQRWMSQDIPGTTLNPLMGLGNFFSVQNLLRPKFPPIGEILIRSMLVSSQDQMHQTEAISDLFLKINTDGFGVMDWSKFSDLVELGYRQSLDPIRHLSFSMLYPGIPLTK
jgi:NTE family protein